METARKYNRLVQHGTQGRSSSHWWRLAEIIKQGTYGKLLASRGLCYKRRTSIGFEPLTLSYPEELSYDLWLGPAQEQAFSSNLVHYNWHWFWEFGNGDIGNQGVHQMDVARWMIPGATLPESVISIGGRFGYVDQGETANTQISIMDFGKDRPQLIFEVRGLETDDYLGEKVGNILHFEEGYVSSGRFHPKNGGSPENLPDVEIDIGPGGGHFDNFIAAVQSGKQSDLNAEILEGHYSSACCHLANVSYQVGREWPFEKEPEAFQGNDFALDAFERMKEHLVKNEVELSETNYKIGRKLKVDKVSERFIDDPRADALATRTYRAPFVVPEKVV